MARYPAVAQPHHDNGPLQSRDRRAATEQVPALPPGCRHVDVAGHLRAGASLGGCHQGRGTCSADAALARGSRVRRFCEQCRTHDTRDGLPPVLGGRRRPRRRPGAAALRGSRRTLDARGAATGRGCQTRGRHQRQQCRSVHARRARSWSRTRDMGSGGRFQAWRSPRDTSGVFHCCGDRRVPWGVGRRGNRSTELPDGIGFRLPARARVAVDVLYKGIDETVVDTPRLALYVARDRPRLRASTATLRGSRPQQVASPQGSESSVRLNGRLVFPIATTLLALRPQLPPNARSLEVMAVRPDGSRDVLLRVPQLRLDWQTPFVFRSPVSLPPGSALEAAVYSENGVRDGPEPSFTVAITSTTGRRPRSRRRRRAP